MSFSFVNMLFYFHFHICGCAGDSKSENKAGLSASKLPSGGIYLEDLKQEEMDPELIGLYLYDYRR